MGFFDKFKNLVTEGAEVRILAPGDVVDLDGDLRYRVLVRAKRDVHLTGLSVHIDRHETRFGETGTDRNKRDRIADSVTALDLQMAVGEEQELTGTMKLRSTGHLLSSSVGRGLEGLAQGLSVLSGGGGSEVRYVLSAVVDIAGSANSADTSFEVSLG